AASAGLVDLGTIGLEADHAQQELIAGAIERLQAGKRRLRRPFDLEGNGGHGRPSLREGEKAPVLQLHASGALGTRALVLTPVDASVADIQDLPAPLDVSTASGETIRHRVADGGLPSSSSS